MAATLPNEVIIEILIRLPVKSLLRFISVNKTWKTLIKSPNFIKSHLTQTLISNSNHLLINFSRNSNHLYYAEIGTHLSFTALIHPLEHRDLNVIGSCNGVVCISQRESIILYNPFTKSLRKLAPLNYIFELNYHTLMFFGFGYDTQNDDFKVLRFVRDYKNDDVLYSETQLYSLRNNSWKSVQLNPYCIDDHAPNRNAVYVNEAMHFIVITKNSGVDCKSILAFDIETETYSLMDCLCYVDEKRDNMCCLSALSGRLCISVFYYLPLQGTGMCNELEGIDLWVMKEYRNKESWVRLLNICEPMRVGIRDYMSPLVYSDDKRRILLVVDGDKYVWCDLVTNSFEVFKTHGLPKPLWTRFFICSLVSLVDY